MLGTVRDWWSLVSRAAWRRVERFLAVGVVTGAIAGSAGHAVVQSYPSSTSMSTLARFPWVWTAVRAVASDLAGLPLVAVANGNRQARRARNRRRQLVDDPALALLEDPNPGSTGHLLRKQAIVDYLCTGNGYLWRVEGDLGEPALYRLHPGWISPIPGPLGIPSGFELKTAGGGRRILSPSEVLHIRDVSWSDGAEAILGESSIRCLHDDLMLELGSKSLAAEQSAKGKPDVAISVDAAGGPNMIRELEQRWETAQVERHGAFITGKGITVTPLGWSPEQMQFHEGRSWTRDAILAVFEVPPARAGLSTANYGTQRQQLKTYWESLIRRAKAFDDAFSKLARPGVRIEHDFTDVEALQVAYTERLGRVSTWVALGATPAEAAAYEGFDEAPVGGAVQAPAAGGGAADPVETPEEGGQVQMQSLEVRLAAYFREAAGRLQALARDAEAGVDLGIWRAWERERLFGVLDDAGVGAEVARWWAEDLTASTFETLRLVVAAAANEGELDDLGLDNLEAFSVGRAHRVAARIRMAEAA